MDNSKYVAVLIKGTAYLSKKDLAKELHLSTASVSKLIKGVQDEISKGRYHRCAVAGNRFNLYAVIDYMAYKDQLVDKNMRKLVPPFDPAGIAELCGYNMSLVRMEQEKAEAV